MNNQEECTATTLLFTLLLLLWLFCYASSSGHVNLCNPSLPSLQLQAKLDRMERRLNILQRRSRDTDDAQDDDTPCHTPEQSHSRHARHERLVRVVQSESSHHGRRHSRSRSSSADPPKGLRSKSGHTPQNSLEVSLRAPSKRLSEDHTHNHTLNKKSRTSKTAEDPLLVIASGYHGLGLQLPHTHTKCAAYKDKESEAARKTDIKGEFINLIK